MSHSTDPIPGRSAAEAYAEAESRLCELVALLQDLNEGAQPVGAAPTLPLSSTQENNLVQVRMGVASSLFAALRWKHEPTARHCLRVALACSSWAEKMGLPPEERDEVELAALLHDIGKIGVPDTLLSKPGPLLPQELAVMESHWLMGREVLRSSCASPEVLDTMTYARAWFDGSKKNFDLVGEAIPRGARMLSIADAFDAMTTDHVYRRAISREKAFNELYRFAGTQFDPKLVELFREMHECDQIKLQHAVARRWLHALDPKLVASHWRLNESDLGPPRPDPNSLFERKLLENMYDAVVFIDANLRVRLWNKGAERLMGISSESVYQRRFLPSFLEMQDENGRPFSDSDCPVAIGIRSGVQWLRRLNVRGRNGKPVAVDAHAIPVIGDDGVCHGMTLLLHDASSEISLEERCQNLHERATKDPLTQVANRAEFDRVHELFVAAHAESKRPCSLIIADIDRFKRVNDTYGHQAGDQVIQSFAAVLKQSCRPGDLVARYGGEEFVMLCADCDNATAVRRAEELRETFSQIPYELLGGKTCTASFGVTEAQPGDTPATMLRRADRALLNAKESGRNTVVQLGSGQAADDAPDGRTSGLRAKGDECVVEQRMVSVAPVYVSIEKLRGFVADHDAEIISLEDDFVRLRIAAPTPHRMRRRSDRTIHYLMEIRFEEDKLMSDREHVKGGLIRTNIHVVVRPQKGRDRRQTDAVERARQLLVSLKAYLMATVIEEPIDRGDAPTEESPKSRGLFRFFRRR